MVGFSDAVFMQMASKARMRSVAVHFIFACSDWFHSGNLLTSRRSSILFTFLYMYVCISGSSNAPRLSNRLKLVTLSLFFTDCFCSSRSRSNLAPDNLSTFQLPPIPISAHSLFVCPQNIGIWLWLDS